MWCYARATIWSNVCIARSNFEWMCNIPLICIIISIGPHLISMHRVWWHPTEWMNGWMDEWMNGLLILEQSVNPWGHRCIFTMTSNLYIYWQVHYKSNFVCSSASKVNNFLYAYYFIKYVCPCESKWLKWIFNRKYCSSIQCDAIAMNLIECTGQLQLTQSHTHTLYLRCREFQIPLPRAVLTVGFKLSNSIGIYLKVSTF